jgi:hypothetical protein
MHVIHAAVCPLTLGVPVVLTVLGVIQAAVGVSLLKFNVIVRHHLKKKGTLAPQMRSHQPKFGQLLVVHSHRPKFGQLLVSKHHLISNPLDTGQKLVTRMRLKCQK